jgi:hypothetical protein
MAKYRFKLKMGFHGQNDPEDKARVEEHVAKGGLPRPIKQVTFKPGDIIETDADLSRFNMEGYPPRFELVSGPGMLPSDGDLEHMTLEALREFAEAEEIDLAGVKGRRPVLDRIRSALAEANAPAS